MWPSNMAASRKQLRKVCFCPKHNLKTSKKVCFAELKKRIVSAQVSAHMHCRTGKKLCCQNRSLGPWRKLFKPKKDFLALFAFKLRGSKQTRKRSVWITKQECAWKASAGPSGNICCNPYFSEKLCFSFEKQTCPVRKNLSPQPSKRVLFLGKKPVRGQTGCFEVRTC